MIVVAEHAQYFCLYFLFFWLSQSIGVLKILRNQVELDLRHQLVIEDQLLFNLLFLTDQRQNLIWLNKFVQDVCFDHRCEIVVLDYHALVHLTLYVPEILLKHIVLDQLFPRLVLDLLIEKFHALFFGVLPQHVFQLLVCESVVLQQIDQGALIEYLLNIIFFLNVIFIIQHVD